ncbi:MAG: flavin reductase family protein, partial [Oscillospiraceae bacterium]|nr:flavin reductase family protein [Oscillospiraceae bacterium]
LTNDKLIRATDLCGVKSGRDGDKFQLAKLTKEPASQLACPMIAESPISLECRVKQVLPLGSHDMFLAEIVAVNVDESLLDEKGKLHLSRAGLMSYSHGEYFGQGRRLGSFGCSVRKKTPPKKTNKRK